jgi:hypothetical protein
MKKPTYAEQLKHPNWQRKRLEILGRDEFRCQVCYDDESTLHVHHKHYHKGRMAWEYEAHELVTLCENCHEALHKQGDDTKDLLAKLNVDGPYSVSGALALIAGWGHQNCGYDLSEHFSASPYNFVLGQVADLIDTFNWKMADLIAFRDALMAVPFEKRQAAVQAMLKALGEGESA